MSEILKNNEIMKQLNNGIIAKRFTADKFAIVLNFLKENYKKNGLGYSWTIDRLNFTYTVARTFHQVSLEDWEKSYMLLEEDGRIIGIVNTEGEKNGESFIQTDGRVFDQETLDTIFDFIEENHKITKDNKTYISIRIKHDFDQLIQEALKRGFLLDEASEIDSMLELTDERSLDYELPEGFRIIDGNDIDVNKAGMVHSRAFGNKVEAEKLKRITLALEEMTKAPSYIKEFDIAVVNKEGDNVAFATLWYDDMNQIGSLEAVGTDQDYRKMGLGKAAIFEAVQRVKKLGVTKIYVGSSQDFYKRLGFVEVDRRNIYTKIYKE